MHYSLNFITGKTWGIGEIQNIASTSKTHSSHIFQATHKFLGSNDRLDLDLSLESLKFVLALPSETL